MNIDRSLIKYTDERDLKGVKAIVIHNTANPNTDADNNVVYLRKKCLGYHFIVDIDGTVYQLQSLKKRAIHCGGRKYTEEATKFFGESNAPSFYHTAEKQHSGSPNNLTIGVCYCYIKESGEPEKETYLSLCTLIAMLCIDNNLNYNGGIWRHHDVTGKNCPNFYVKNEFIEFVKLLHDVVNEMTRIVGEKDLSEKHKANVLKRRTEIKE